MENAINLKNPGCLERCLSEGGYRIQTKVFNFVVHKYILDRFLNEIPEISVEEIVKNTGIPDEAVFNVLINLMY